MANNNRGEGNCSHFSIRGYVAAMREKDYRIGAPFPINAYQMEPLYIPKFKRWSCRNCLLQIENSRNVDNSFVEEAAVNASWELRTTDHEAANNIVHAIEYPGSNRGEDLRIDETTSAAAYVEQVTSDDGEEIAENQKTRSMSELLNGEQPDSSKRKKRRKSSEETICGRRHKVKKARISKAGEGEDNHAYQKSMSRRSSRPNVREKEVRLIIGESSSAEANILVDKDAGAELDERPDILPQQQQQQQQQNSLPTELMRNDSDEDIPMDIVEFMDRLQKERNLAEPDEFVDTIQERNPTEPDDNEISRQMNDVMRSENDTCTKPTSQAIVLVETHSPLVDLHKGKVVLDLDLNIADPNAVDVEVTEGGSNEVIPAMQLLLLTDETTSTPQESISGTEDCRMNRNPADLEDQDSRNLYMMSGEELKLHSYS